MQRTTLSIDGMSCGHCVRAVTEALQELPGVRIEKVTVGSATVSYDPGTTTPQALTGAIEDAGYSAAID